MTKKKSKPKSRHNRNHKYRYINTRFWNDSLIASLAPLEKLLFMYLITNEHTNISGIYELPLKIMAMELSLEEVLIEQKLMPAITEKIKYIEGYVIVKNFVRYQSTGSKTVREGILNCLKEVPRELLIKVINERQYVLPMDYIDMLGIPYVYPSDTLYIPPAQDINTLLNSDKKEGIDRVSIPPTYPIHTPTIPYTGDSIYSDSDLDSDSDLKKEKNTDFSNEKSGMQNAEDVETIKQEIRNKFNIKIPDENPEQTF